MEKLKYVAQLLGEAIDDQRSSGEALQESFSPLPSFSFRKHQTTPAAALLKHCEENNYGVLSAACGCGKTVVMTWTAGKLGVKTLILVDMSMLISQWADSFRFVWGKEVQVITKDTTVFGDVCIATFQLLHSNPELVLQMKDMFEMLLI